MNLQIEKSGICRGKYIFPGWTDNKLWTSNFIFGLVGPYASLFYTFRNLDGTVGLVDEQSK